MSLVAIQSSFMESSVFSINKKKDSELTTGNLQPLWTQPKQKENHNQAILTNQEYVPEVLKAPQPEILQTDRMFIL